jgi:MFS family permease
MVLLVNGIVIMLGAGALNALDVFFAVRNLHANQTMYGVISGGLGLGALTGAVALSAFAQRIGLVRLFCWSLTGLGASFVVYSRLTSFAPALVVLFLAGIVMAGVNVAVMPLVLRETPRELLGRVSAVLNQVMQTANVVSVVVAGALVSTVLGDFHAKALGMAFGPVDTIFTVAGLLAILGGIYSAVSLRGRSAARAESAEAVA